MDTTATTYTESITLPINTTTSTDSILSSPKETPRPVSKAERIQTIDMIRGFALLGILLMNIPIFGIDNSSFYFITHGSHDTWDYRTLATIVSFFNGTMRGLFSMLFGAGMVLFTLNKKELEGGPTVAEYYYRRLLWLVLFGVINAYVFLWPGDILYYYGLIGMILYPFRKTAPKWLLLLGLLCIGLNIYKQMLNYTEFRGKRLAYVEAVAAEKAKKKLTPKQEEAKKEWLQIEQRRVPQQENIQRNVSQMQSDYGTVFTHLLPRNSDSEAWGMYHGIWDMLSMMFIGMALFGLGFFSNKVSTSTYGMTLLIGYGVGIPIGWIFFSRAVAAPNIGVYLDTYRVPHWVLYDARRLLLALGHASVLMLIFRSRLLPWLMKSLSNVGQMAFTNYLMQSIICTLFFYGYGLGYYNKLSYHQLYYVVAVVWIFQIIFSAIWLRYYRFGPFEWLWRSLTYWKFQPMRIKTTIT